MQKKDIRMGSFRRVALVSGGGPGTSAAIARRLTSGGYAVAMLARNAERLRALEAELTPSRGYACDVTDTRSIDTTLAAVRDEFGEPEVLVHNAEEIWHVLQQVRSAWSFNVELRPFGETW